MKCSENITLGAMKLNNATPAELAALLSQNIESKTNIEPQAQKYVIYARKSTESAERQIRSLDDQVKECLKTAETRGYAVVKILRESESAKEPDIRPIFKQMLADINEGKYTAVLAWHPDRLARNMKEAGEIIDLLDKNIIKHLDFVTSTFENTTSGKMHLGISFVLAKQYSDQLSTNVKRGMYSSADEGRYMSSFKHGYKLDVNKYLRPDGENFALLKKAWKM